MLPLVTMRCGAAAEPELRTAQNGQAVCALRVVANQRRQDQSGRWVDDKVCFLDVVFFGPLAEAVAAQVRKGEALEIRGRLNTETWDDAGQRRSRLRLLGDAIAKPILGARPAQQHHEADPVEGPPL